MSIKRWIRNWLMDDGVKVSSRAIDSDGQPEQGAQISINNAINGKVLTIRTYRPNHPQYSSNWITDLYVLKDGESLTEALTMLLITKGLEK